MKKFLSITLALLMVCVMLPVVALADEGITTADALKYAVEAGGNVTLGANITASITVKKDTTVTLNLGGYKLTNEANKDTIYVEMGGTLIIEGTGTVDNDADSKAALYNNGTVTLNGGTYDRSAETSTGATKEERGDNSWYTVCNHGTLTINSGVTITTANKDTTKGHYSSLIENGYQNQASGNERTGYVNGTNQEYPSLEINGGEFFGGINTIKNDDNGIATINGGSSTNYYQSSVQNHHKMIINNGSFTGEAAWSVLNCGVSSCPVDATHDAHELTIVNGTFTGAVGITVGSAAINGGTVNGKIVKGDTATISITGGTFTDKENAKKYIPEGKTINSNGTVVDKTITIISGDTTPETPKTDDQKNPATGANDVVAAAVALMAVSALGMAVLTRKK